MMKKETKTGYWADIDAALATLPLTDLSGSHVLVTGATGLIGACVTDFLLRQPDLNIRVTASGRNMERARRRFAAYEDDPRLTLLRHDVGQPLPGNVPYDYIIHAASNASPNFFAQQPVEVVKSNIYGVANLMDYGLSHGMKRLLYVSSGEIYGEGTGTVFAETSSGYVDCAKPRSCYPSAKRAAETLCVSYAAEYGADVVIARPCHTYGPGFTESDNRAYAQFIRAALEGHDIVLRSSGTQYRSWLYVVDCASALLWLLTRGKGGEAYNVAHAESNVSIRQLAETIAHHTGRRVVFDIPDTTDAGNTTPITRAVFATEKLESLGWHPLTDLDSGISHTIEWQRRLARQD